MAKNRPHTRRWRAAILPAAVATLVAMTACSSGDSVATPGSEHSDAVIRWAMPNTVVNWDPIVTGATGVSTTIGAIYEPFLTEDENGAPAPGLAESWEYNEDGTAVTFTLREGLTFHDGSPVNAEAAAFYFDRALNQTNSALIGSYSNIDHVTADSERDFTVHLKQVDYQVPYLLSIRAGFLTSKAASEADPAAFNARTPVGAGPFKVVELVPESHIVLEKFDDYWNAENIHIDRIEITFGIDTSSLINGIRTGAYNFSQVTGPQIEEARRAGLDLVYDVSKNWYTNFLNVNRKVAPFDDPKVVDAFRHAIDPEEFVATALLGEGVVTHQIVPPGDLLFNEILETAYPYDPDKARQLLTEAGYPDGFDIELSAGVFQSDAFTELVQAQLGAVGVRVAINKDPNWAQGYFAKETPFSLYMWVGRNSPTQALTEHFDVNGVLNLSSPLVNEEFQELITEIRATPIEDPGFAELVQQANAVGFLDGSTIPLSSYPTVWVKTPDISSDFQNGSGWLNWTGITVGEETQ